MTAHVRLREGAGVPSAGGPRAGRMRPGRRVRRAAALIALLLLSVAAGFGTAVAAATAARRPAVFLTAGLLVTGLCGAAALWWASRSMPRSRRTRTTVAGAALLLVVAAVAVTAPLPDPRTEPAAVAGLAYWKLPTGSRLAYVKVPGAAPAHLTPIVVLHGGPGISDMAGDAAYFGRLAALGHDVYVYDQLGAGRSTRLADPAGYGMERDVADLEGVRLAVGAQRMVLVGHSYGGALAAHYLAAHPQRVERLVLSSPAPLDPSDSSGDRAATGLDTGARLHSFAAALAPRALLGYALTQVDPAAAHSYLGDDEADARNDTILSIAEPALHCAPEQSAGPVRRSGFYAWQYPQSATAPPLRDVRPALSGLGTPTLLLKGECDYLSWRSAVDYRLALPDTTLLYLGGAGHNTYEDRPSAVMAAVRAFLTDAPMPQQPYTRDTPPVGYRGPA